MKFIFQPAEENVSGAKAMIDDGALENPAVDALIGLTRLPLKTSASARSVRYVLMAAVDRFIITSRARAATGHFILPWTQSP